MKNPVPRRATAHPLVARLEKLADQAGRAHIATAEHIDLIDREPGARSMFDALAALSDDVEECLDIAKRSLGADLRQGPGRPVIGPGGGTIH